MKPAFWLAWRELASRKSAFAIGIGMVGVAVALCAATELISRAKEAAVAAEIDHMGPALRLIPAGRTARDLARFELGSAQAAQAVGFTSNDVRRLRRELSRWIRAVEGRLLLRAPVGVASDPRVGREGRTVSVIGIDPKRMISPFDVLERLGDDKAVLGAALADRLHKGAGSEIAIKGKRFRIAAVLPETASADDLALYLSLRPLQNLFDLSDVVNEIRVFPAPGAPVERIASYVSAKHPEINVINTYRGTIAEGEMNRNLRGHRRVLYLVTGAIIALCILVWSYLNAGERRLEMATVVAVGGTSMTVLSMLVMRAAIVAFLGALAGYVAGAMISLAQDFESALSVVLSWQLLVAMSAGAVALSISGALIASMFSAFREHVTVLQEW